MTASQFGRGDSPCNDAYGRTLDHDFVVERITALRCQHGRRLEATEIEDLYSQGFHEGACSALNILLSELI